MQRVGGTRRGRAENTFGNETREHVEDKYRARGALAEVRTPALVLLPVCEAAGLFPGSARLPLSRTREDGWWGWSRVMSLRWKQAARGPGIFVVWMKEDMVPASQGLKSHGRGEGCKSGRERTGSGRRWGRLVGARSESEDTGVETLEEGSVEDSGCGWCAVESGSRG